MFPGDSLVDKIFEEGLKEAQAVIVVISSYSISKPWVKEEINAAFVKRIESKCKIIPIVLDNASVPECLSSTLWEPINNLDNYAESLNRIVGAVFNYVDKPQVKEAPKYMTTIIDNYTSLNKVDSIIFTEACRLAFQNGDTSITTHILYQNIQSFEIDETNFYDSIDILDRKGYIDGTRVINGDIPFFTISTMGMDSYIRTYINDFDLITKEVCYNILNKPLSNIGIAQILNQPIPLVNHVYYLLQQKGLIKFNKVLSGDFYVYDISPELKRIVE